MAVKFADVDVLDFLERIMQSHTRYYKDDFDLDKELLSKMAISEQPADRHFIWLCRPCGTHSLRERDCYLEGSYENKVLRFYLEQTRDPILAYAVHLTGITDEKIQGDVYELDYPTLVERSKLLTCPIHTVTVAFEDGYTAMLPYAQRRSEINRLTAEYGCVTALHYAPESERELMTIVLREHTKRDFHAVSGNTADHIQSLQNRSLHGQLQQAKSAAVIQANTMPQKGTQER